MCWPLAFPHSRSRRLVSRFRCSGHGLHEDTGQFKPVEQRVDREQRFCPVCASDTAEYEHHFVFDCPAGTGLLPFSGDQPLRCLSLYMTTGLVPSFCMNALHTGLCC